MYLITAERSAVIYTVPSKIDTLCPGVRPMGCQMFVRLKTSYYGVLF
jgi:hypothetical protein